MASLPRPRLTAAEFLAGEELSTGRNEFYRGEVFAMAGGSAAHNRIAGNVFYRLAEQLEGKPCQPNNGDVMVKIEATGLYTYPDVSVGCPPVEREPAPIEVLLNPKVLVEVLSPSTELHDRKTKLRHYQRIGSVDEILLVDQEEARIELYTRQGTEAWTLTVREGLAAEVELGSIACRLPLALVYANVEFPPAAAAVEGTKPM